MHTPPWCRFSARVVLPLSGATTKLAVIVSSGRTLHILPIHIWLGIQWSWVFLTGGLDSLSKPLTGRMEWVGDGPRAI